MARARTGKAGKGPKTEAVAGSAPVVESRGGDDDLDDDGDEPKPPAVDLDLDDDDEGDEDSGDEEKLESQVEMDAANALQLEENQAALRAHDALQAKARGNRTSAEQVRKVIEAAKQKVRHRHLVKRKPGIYTAQPLTTVNEKGERIQCPPYMRLPDAMVARLKKARDLKRLIDSGVLDDLR